MYRSTIKHVKRDVPHERKCVVVKISYSARGTEPHYVIASGQQAHANAWASCLQFQQALVHLCSWSISQLTCSVKRRCVQPSKPRYIFCYVRMLRYTHQASTRKLFLRRVATISKVITYSLQVWPFSPRVPRSWCIRDAVRCFLPLAEPSPNAYQPVYIRVVVFWITIRRSANQTEYYIYIKYI